MNIGMTIETGPGDHSVFPGCGRPLEGLEFRINCPRVLGPVMTALAKLGDLAGEELGMVAPVGSVAAQAIFFDGGMLPHKGPSLFGMALVAQIVKGIRFDHPGAESAVVIMAVRAFQFPFANRVVGLFILLGPDRAVADIAEVGLGGFQIFPGPGMHGVAVVAGNIGNFVLAQIPEGEIPGVSMAGKALGGLGFGIGDFLAEDENPHPFLSAFLHMGGARTMAGLAGILAGRTVRDPLLGVGGLQVTLVVIFMASFADLRPDDALASPDISRRQDPPEKNDHG